MSLRALALLALLCAAIAGCGGDDDGGGGDSGDSKGSPLEQAAEEAGCELKDPPNEGANHVDGRVAYRSNPPTSGDHFEVAAEDGVYEEPPPTEALVHALEHGRIVYQYDPEAGDEVAEQLQELYEDDPAHVILAANETDMPYEVAATAWDHLIGCDEMSDAVIDAFAEFRDEYRDEGPEDVP